MNYISLTEIASFQAKRAEEFSITMTKSGRLCFHIPSRIVKALKLINGDKIDILFNPSQCDGLVRRVKKGYTIRIDKNGRASISTKWRPGMPTVEKRTVIEYFVDGKTDEVLFTFSKSFFGGV